MKRKIIEIDEEKCVGCGACADACHEGAIQMVDGKAKLMRDDYCDGLGDCLPSCPVDAIHFVEREALAYNAEAVAKSKGKKHECHAKENKLPCGCSGTMARSIKHDCEEKCDTVSQKSISRLSQWPVQIKLLNPSAQYFKDAKLLVAADCTAYAYANFHEDFIKDHITLIGCPKLDNEDYSEKLTEILIANDIKSISVVRMEVPCCKGIEVAVKETIIKSGKIIPWGVTIISTDGKTIQKL